MTRAAVGALRFESPVNLTSGCNNATMASRSPDAMAAMNAETTWSCDASRAGTGCSASVRRARDASWRAVAVVVPSTSAISENGTANPSWSTNATR